MILNFDDMEIDEEKVKRIKALVLAAEKENIKTGKLTDSDMVNQICEIIEKTVDE